MILYHQRELEGAMGKMCVHFDQRKYDQIQEAYSILGKTQVRLICSLHFFLAMTMFPLFRLQSILC